MQSGVAVYTVNLPPASIIYCCANAAVADVPDSYVHAKSWRDLESAFTKSLAGSSLDEMTLLLHDSIPGRYERRCNHVRPVIYGRLDEIPALLMADPNVSSTPLYQQRSRVGVAMRAQPSCDYNGQGQRADMSRERIADENETGKGACSDGNHEQEFEERMVNAAKAIQDAYRRRLKQRRADAARKIQTAYRHYLERKSVVSQEVDAPQARYWYLLRMRSLGMEWSKGSRYYLLFRVPLAYILVCLDIIQAFVESEKKKAKKRVMTEDHRDLEELMKVLVHHRCDSVDYTLYDGSNLSSSKLLKNTIALQRKLSPSSKFHEGRSVKDLQGAVLEAKEIVESLDNIPGSIETKNRIKKRWDRGSTWIFEKQGSRAKGKRAEKPKLVLDREDLL
jgi:hypothetical protein